MSETRLNAYLARSGVTSRRGADKLIASGSVLVNGHVPPPDGVLVDPARDVVTVDGRAVKLATQHRYLMLNKPLGVITTAKDEAGRTSVLDVLGEGASGHRVFPVGRLDADSTGLLLITDDGEVAYRLTHPRYKVDKEYIAIVGGSPSRADLARLRSGVQLEDGVTAPAEVDVLRVLPGPAAEVRVVIREGRHRQVRRMLMAVGHRVLALNRTGFGPLRLGRLKPGNWRVLRDGEIAALRRAAGLQ
ncbi:MAG: rRNA pseudouridine synthase [Chloroflexi bacterium]|nr:MAG: rRNA pseudouridine synthase [Chloroflexota bacterium]